LIAEDNLRLELLRYLTGAMTEDERAVFEARLIDDQDFSDAVALSEQNLIDSYALEKLDPDTAHSIRSWIEATPRRLERVEMARAFLGGTRRKIYSKQSLVILAFAACILVAAGVTLSVRNKSDLKAASPGKVATTNAAPGGVAPAAKSSPKPQVILLVAERIRGEQPIATYRIQPDAPVRLQVLLISEKARATYSVRIMSFNQPHVIWEQEALKPDEKDGQPFIETTLPAGSLPPASYNIVVTGIDGELVSHFVVRP